MKKLNIRLLLILIVGFVGSAIGVHFLHGYQVSKNLEGLMNRADAAQADGEVDEQIRLLQRYVRHEPDDIDTQARLFRIIRKKALEEANGRMLFFNFSAIEKALLDNPDHEGLRREAYISANIMGRWADAEDHLKQLPPSSLTPEDHVNWALIKWRNNERGEAEQKLCEMIGFDMEALEFTGEGDPELSGEVNAYTALAFIYLRDHAEHGDPTIPKLILSKAIERNPESADAYIKRAGFLREHYETDEARANSLADVRKALELAPEDLSVITTAARTAFADQDFQLAESVLQRGKEVHPDESIIYRLAALSSKLQDRMEEAEARLNEGLERMPTNSDLLQARAGLEIDTNQLDAAQHTITRLSEKRSFSRVQLDFLKARLLVAREEYMPASKILERLQPRVESTQLREQIDSQLATCYQRMGMQDRLQGLTANTDNDRGRWQLASSYVSAGRYMDAAEIYRDLLSSDQVRPEARGEVLRRLLDALIRAERAKPEPQRNWSRVDQVAAKIMEGQTDPMVREALEINLLERKGKRSEALRRAQAAISRYPREATFRMTLAKLTPDHQQAMELLKRLEQSLGLSVEIRVAQINRLLSHNDPEELRTKLTEYEADLTRFEEGNRQRLMQVLVSAYRQAKMRDEALALAKQMVDNNEISSLILYFDVAIEAQDDEAVNDALERIAQLATKDSAEWRICEARRRLEKIKAGRGENLDPADIMTLVEAARRERPNFAPIYAIQADVLLLQGRDDEAVEAMKVALEHKPGDRAYLEKLYSVLRDNNRIREANQVLAQLPRQGNSNQAALVEIQQLLNTNPQAAIAKAEASFSPDSQDPTVLHQLAKIYFAAQRYANAIETLQKAVKLDESNRRLWLLLVRSYMNNGQQQQAQQIIPAAREHLASLDAEERWLAIGQMRAESGQVKEAIQAYNEGLKADPKHTLLLVNKAKSHQFLKQNDQFNDTLDTLIEIEDPQTEADKASIGQARRMKAQQLYATGVYSDFLKAIELIEHNRNRRGKLVGEDLLLYLQMCANRPEASSRQKATDLLEQIRTERSLTVKESVILAGLRYQDGDWREAESMILDVMATTQNPSYTLTYISWLVEREDTDAAARYLSTSQLNMEAPQVLPLAMMIMAQKGQSKQAYGKIQSLLSAGKLNHGQAAVILERVAKYDARFFEAAKRQWKKLLKTNPNQVANYVDFLTRIPDAGGLNDALDLAEQQLEKAVSNKNSQAAQYYLGLGLKALRASRTHIEPNNPQYARVYKWFEPVAKAGVDDISLAMYRFDFFDIRQDHEKLKQLYSQFLQRTDTTKLQRAMIRNNLAFLYALEDDGDRALQTIGDAIDQLGPRSDLLDTRGLALMVTGQIEQAVEDLKEAAQGNPHPSVLFHLALAQHKARSAQEAASALDRSLELGLDPRELSPQERKLFDELFKALKDQLTQTVPVNH